MGGVKVTIGGVERIAPILNLRSQRELARTGYFEKLADGDASALKNIDLAVEIIAQSLHQADPKIDADFVLDNAFGDELPGISKAALAVISRAGFEKLRAEDPNAVSP